MKRLTKSLLSFFLSCFAFFLILLISKPVLAQTGCVQTSPPCPPTRPATCSVGGVFYCCGSPADCSFLSGNEGRIGNPLLPSNLSNLSGPAFLSKGVSLGISFGLIIGFLVFLFILIAGGISWISSGNDKNKLEGAQKQITHALVGLALLFLIFVIIKLVEYIFGISITSINIPTF